MPGPYLTLHNRDDRRQGEPGDQRRSGQRDRDRILYTTALRRLAGVTQVVAPGEGHIFHNRLTHTLEVAQIGRRLAEKIVGEALELANALGGIDPEVVEAGALAHDLGHPPFGHITEKLLDKLVVAEGDPDGYEGNAQSFRIITKLAIRRENQVGLNLTRATLNATLKYPVLQSEDANLRVEKWGAYRTELEDYNHARGRHADELEGRTVEAQLMDWADDIAYSIHDTEDFYRAGFIPLERLSSSRTEQTKFLDNMFDRGKVVKVVDGLADRDVARVFEEMLPYIEFIDEPYSGSFRQRARLRTFTAKQISIYIQGTKLREPIGMPGDSLLIEDQHRIEVAILKELVWCYVINNPSLAGQQHGQRQVITNIFNVFKTAVLDNNWAILPTRHQEEMEKLRRDHGNDIPAKHRIRVAADAIASLTDQQALRLHQRFFGILPGSILDPIVL